MLNTYAKRIIKFTYDFCQLHKINKNNAQYVLKRLELTRQETQILQNKIKEKYVREQYRMLFTKGFWKNSTENKIIHSHLLNAIIFY